MKWKIDKREDQSHWDKETQTGRYKDRLLGPGGINIVSKL